MTQDKSFWAHVRTISQEVGYTDRKTRAIRVPSLEEIRAKFDLLGLQTSHIADDKGTLTELGATLNDYFKFRALVLNNTVQGQLMNKDTAKSEFEKLRSKLKPKCPLPMNKQKGDKKNFAFLTGMVNMLIEANIGKTPCDFDPRSLTTFTHESMPLRTLARRVDGAFPAILNPVALWETKEYYYTNTFGSRVADGVYETLLDGLELEEVRAVSGRNIQHVLIVDDHFTWWQCGRSYLCRMIDMLHMGLVDEVIFGREVLTRLPVIVKEWRSVLENMQAQQAKKL